MDGFLGGYVTRWYDDPFSLGAYSTLLPGGSPRTDAHWANAWGIVWYWPVKPATRMHPR